MVELISECSVRNDRVVFNQGWRKDRWESKQEKLRFSVQSHFGADSAGFEAFWKIIEAELGKWITVEE
jgi:hypothetical protein